MYINIGVVILLLIAEKIAPRIKTTNSSYSNFWVLANLLIFPLYIPYIVKFFNMGLFSVFHTPLINLQSFSVVWQFLIFLVLLDFVRYFHHYIFHRFDFLWKIHSIHHSSTEINTLAAFKMSWLDALVGIFLSCVLNLIVQVDLSVIVLINYLLYVACVWQHANIDYAKLRLGFMRKLFITPLTHRIHHEKIENSGHKNIGLVFNFWDRVFGTYSEVELKKDTYGISSPDYPYHSNFKQFVYPFGSPKSDKA